MDGYGPEVSIFKSVFSFSGLDSSQVANENGINEVLKVIRTFVTKCENEKGNFKNLYDILLAKPYGMRKGIIPLFIAYILRLYKENIVLYYSGKEVELSASILSNLNENPAKYELLMEMGTLDREVYLDRLETMFATYADNKAGSANRVYAVMRSMPFTAIQDLISYICETLNSTWSIPSVIDLKMTPKVQNLANIPCAN